jgi:hypothetical protein
MLEYLNKFFYSKYLQIIITKIELFITLIYIFNNKLSDRPIVLDSIYKNTQKNVKRNRD